MKRKITFLIAALCAVMMVTKPMKVLATDWNYTFNASSGIVKGSNTLNGIAWTIDHDSQYSANEAAGYHVGSGSKSVSYLQASTSGISGTITKIVVNSKGNGSNGTIGVSVDGTAYSAKDDNTAITNTSQNFEFTGSSEGEIIIMLSYPSAVTNNFYLTSIAVTYTTGPVKYTVTYDANGATNGSVPSDANEYNSGATVTVLGNNGDLEKTGHDWTCWNTKNDGSGTDYVEDATFPITSNTTLYAKWTAHMHSLTMPSSDTYGSYGASSTGSVAYGTTVSLTYTKASSEYDNYGAIWSINGAPINGDTFSMPDEDVTVSVLVTDCQFLPFTWAGGTTSTLNAMIGVTTYGLGSSDYTSHSPYYQKMDSKDDYIQIKTYSKPSKVTVGVKMVGGSNTSKIKVQESANGSSFSDVQELTISGKQNDILSLSTSNSFSETTRYVRIIKSVHGSNIGVGPITINMSGSQTFTDFTIPANNTITIVNGSVLTVTGTLTNNGSAANLIIEEGGQLILKDANAGVQATVKKSVATWTGSLAKGTNPGWQTISTSTHDDGEDFVSFSNVENLIYEVSSTPRYNVYYYDEENIQWINNLAAPTYSILNVGQGYIYRTGGSTDLEYKGYVNTGDIEVDLSYKCETASFKGFNLIGNPYTHSIYKGGTGSAIVNGSILEAKYYALNLTTGTFELTNDGTEIPRGTAIMVQTKSSGKLTMKNSSVYVAPAKAGNDNIWFTVKNENFQDFACVDFKPGRGLNKIDHYNEDAPMLYINHNGENFGSVNMSDDTKSINLNFKAMTMGKYTLSLKPEGNFNYIHVIDKLTGEDVDMLLEGEYSFIASPSDADNRFIVKLGYQPDYGNDNDIFAYQSGSEIYVTGNGELQIFDVTGRRVMTTTINGAESISIPNQGVYIFKLNEKVQKIVVR